MREKQSGVTRRAMIKTTGKIAAASALAGVTLPHVPAGESGTIQSALVGCGGRGTGAAANALATKQGPTRLTAMVDVFRDKLDRSFQSLQRNNARQMDVPNDRKFIG